MTSDTDYLLTFLLARRRFRFDERSWWIVEVQHGGTLIAAQEGPHPQRQMLFGAEVLATSIRDHAEEYWHDDEWNFVGYHGIESHSREAAESNTPLNALPVSTHLEAREIAHSPLIVTLIAVEPMAVGVEVELDDSGTDYAPRVRLRSGRNRIGIARTPAFKPGDSVEVIVG